MRPSFKTLLSILTIVILISVGTFISLYRGPSSDGGSLNVDENSDGLWDDFESRVNSAFKNQPNIKLGAKQMGRALQIILIDPSNAREKDVALSKSMSCLVASGLNDGLSIQEAAELVGQVRDLMLTTPLREERYITFNVGLRGAMLDANLPDIKNCEFKIEGK